MKNPKVIAAFQFNSELIFCSGYAHCTVKNTILAKAHSLLTLKKKSVRKHRCQQDQCVHGSSAWPCVAEIQKQHQ